MKYIKPYEGKHDIYYKLYKYFKKRSDKLTKYKVGQYVLTMDGKIHKIGAVDHSSVGVVKDFYWMETDDPDDNDPYVNEDIIGEATPEEIEQYELERKADKYNL